MNRSPRTRTIVHGMPAWGHNRPHFELFAGLKPCLYPDPQRFGPILSAETARVLFT